MKKIFSFVLCAVMLASMLAVATAAVSGENGKTGWEAKPADVSEGWTRYQLEEQDVYLKGVLAAADNAARKHAQNHYSNGLAVNFGTDASNIPVYTDFSEMTLDDSSSRIEVKVTSEYAGASKITLYTRQTYNGTEELPLCVGIKVNDGAVQKVLLTPAPVEGAGDYGKRICYTTVDIELKAGENVIRISPSYQTATTKNYWVTFDAMDVMTVAAPATEWYPLDVNWNYGYIKNDGTVHNQGNDGWGYSHTDVITIPNAGTTITFTDDASGFASGSVYVVSSWKQVDGEWVFDANGATLKGDNGAASPFLKDGKHVYTYTTTKDNETIRLTYASGETPSSVPASHPTVYTDVEIVIDNTGDDNTGDDNTGDDNANTGSETLSVVILAVVTLGTAVVLSKKANRK